MLIRNKFEKLLFLKQSKVNMTKQRNNQEAGKEIVFTLKERDVLHLAHPTYWDDDGNTLCILGGKSARRGDRLLKCIVASLGFECSDGDDFIWENGNCDWEVKTTYPKARYEALSAAENKRLAAKKRCVGVPHGKV